MPDVRTDLLARRRAAEATRRRRRKMIAGTSALAAVAMAVGVALGSSAGEQDTGSGETSAAVLRPLPDLSGAQLAGQRLIAGFEGQDVPAGLRRQIRGGRLAGVILFADNIGGRSTTKRLIAELQGIPRPDGLDSPLAVMVDQEGGLVKRVEGPPTASGEEMGQRGAAFASRQGAATARSLGGLGFNIDLAPVLDVGRRGSAISREGRSFGRRPSTVIGTAVNGFAAGLRSGGLAATAKHFPGFGAAEINTDFAVQEIDLSRVQLRRTDEPPFQAFADAGGELVMLSLATYPAFGQRPAALTRSIATRELRDRIGFEGVSITDSLDAEAALAAGGRGRVATLAADAGSDLLLYGSWRTARTVSTALSSGLRSGKLDRDEFETSVKRVLSLRDELGG